MAIQLLNNVDHDETIIVLKYLHILENQSNDDVIDCGLKNIELAHNLPYLLACRD